MKEQRVVASMWRGPKPRRRFSDPAMLHAGRIKLALRARRGGKGLYPFLQSAARPPGGVSSPVAAFIAALVAATALVWLVAGPHPVNAATNLARLV